MTTRRLGGPSSSGLSATWSRGTVTIATVAALMLVLTGCGGINDRTVGEEGLAFFVHGTQRPSGGNAAEVFGTLTTGDGCILLDQDGNRYPVVWPMGTTIADTDPLVIELPSGQRLGLGEQVSGGGGYPYADTLDIDVPAACLNEYGEMAVFNPDDDPTITNPDASDSDDTQATESGPAGPAPDVDGPVSPPPPAWLETSDGPRWMAYSTFCWDDGCVDMVPPDQLPDVPQVGVSEGDQLTFHLGFDPTEVELWFPARDDHVSLPAQRQVSWTVDEYSFAVLMARPDGGGDASYVIEVVAPSTDPTGSGDDAVNVFRGAEHCGWDSVRIIRVSADVAPPRTEGDQWVDFVRDSDGVLPERLIFGEFEADATRPDDADATGLQTPYGDLWLSPSEPDVAYLITDDGTQRWPAADPGCD